MKAKWAGRFVEGDDESGKHGDEDGLICETFPLFVFCYPFDRVIYFANLVLCIGCDETRSDGVVVWEKQGWAKARDDERDEESEVMEGFFVVVCLLYPMESVIDVGGV